MLRTMFKLKKLSKKLMSGINWGDFDKNFVDKSFNYLIRDIGTKVTIKDNEAYFDEPSRHHDRYEDVKYIIKEVCKKYKVEDCKFIVLLNDSYGCKFPAFSAIRSQPKNILNIPMPMGNRRGMDTGCGTPIKGWDKYIKKTIKNNISWEDKKNKAVFRGKLSKQTWANGQYGKKKAKHWTELTRGKLYEMSRNQMFDVGFTKIENIPLSEGLKIVEPINFPDQQKYKYIISVGTNADWAERLRVHFFTNSVTIKHEAESIEWFYPMLKPWKHYIPCDITFSNLNINLLWAIHNQSKSKKIVANANKFAKKYLNEKSMIKMTYYLIKNYSSNFGRL